MYMLMIAQASQALWVFLDFQFVRENKQVVVPNSIS